MTKKQIELTVTMIKSSVYYKNKYITYTTDEDSVTIFPADDHYFLAFDLIAALKVLMFSAYADFDKTTGKVKIHIY